MNTRRQLIQLIPATTLSRLLPLAGLSATAGLLSACGKQPESTGAVTTSPPAAPAAPAVAEAPAAPAPAAPAATAAGPMVDEKDAQAVSLGYVSDATRADKAKYSKYADGQHCGNCALYQGAADSAQGPCPLFAGKQVSSKAWCSAYAKKTA